MKKLIVALAVLAIGAPVAMAERPPEVKVSPTTAKSGSTLTFSLPANEFCPAGEKIWLISGLFRQAVGAHTVPTGTYKGDPGFSTTAAANGSFSIKVKIKPKAHLVRGFAEFWIICKERRLDGETLKTK
jgi:hypothetical protein